MSSKIEPWLCEKHKIYIQGGYECYRCYRESAIAAPVVEREPIPVVGMLINGVVHNFKDETLVALNGTLVPEASELYRAPPELAELQAKIDSQSKSFGEAQVIEHKKWADHCDELQATIARLTAENERLKTACSKEFESVQQLSAEVERLKGGQGEPFGYWLYPKNLPLHGRFSKPDPDMQSAAVVEAFDITPLYTSQPTPVSVVLPELPVDWRTRFEEDQDSNEDGIASFSPDSYMQDEINELRACLGKVKELNK